MECVDVRQWLSAELDGRLAPTEGALLAEHVAGCSRCAGRRAVLSEQRSALASRAREMPPPPRIVAQAEAILSGRPAGNARRDRYAETWPAALRRRWFYLLPAGAAAGL